MKNKLVISIPTLFVILLVTYFFPWRKINWGTLRVGPERTITVSGTAKKTEINQIARFSAGVTVTDADKQKAVSEVETKMTQVVDAVKNFGIEDKDIQTESVNVYQIEETFYEPARGNPEAGNWRANSSISIVLRDVSKASELTSLLTSLETTNVYGPNFSMDDTQDIETELLESAINDARAKAEIVATAQNAKLGDVITISEGFQQNNIFARSEAVGLGGGMPMEPGSAEISKTVTVTFAIK